MSIFNFGGLNSPPRRPLIFPSATSPFCTSPSQLQDVTLEQEVSVSNSLGLRSPTAAPMGGRSVKEFEEQLSNLKKENFNLKLRIYFLEERMGSNFNLDKEQIIKKNVELNVDIRSLKKDVQEKHDLLCQAVKAMELEEEEHKKMIKERDDLLEEYRTEYENLKTQLHDLKRESETFSQRSYQSAVGSSPRASSVQTSSSGEVNIKIRSLEDELSQEKENNAAVQLLLDQKDVQIKQLLERVDELKRELSEYVERSNNVDFCLEETRAKYQGLSIKLEESQRMADELNSENRELRKRQTILMTDYERERKRYEKLKTASDLKIAELQTKLEAALVELKKSQDLVVSRSESAAPTGYTDAVSFSVPEPATSAGPTQTDSFLAATCSSPVSLSPVSSPSSSATSLVTFEQLMCERDHHQQKILKLKAERMKACKIIQTMIQAKSQANEEIELLKERIATLQNGAVQESGMGESSEENPQHYKNLVRELQEKIALIETALSEKDGHQKSLSERCDAMSKQLQEREARIAELECGMIVQKQANRVEEEFIKSLQDKEDEIHRLNTKLEKRNCDLQGLVNKELWDKNREIQKLQSKQMLEGKDAEIEKLRQDVTLKEVQLGIIKGKISELGIEIDLQNGNINFCERMRTQLRRSSILRLESCEMCAILSGRLEELAIFLDSLVRQKNVLGFLGSKENKRLREIIDQSLSLSRSLTQSMLGPDQSLLELTNLTGILNETGDVNSLTYRSHLFHGDEDMESSKIIETLRKQIVNLNFELQLRDVELGKLNNVASEDGGDQLPKTPNTTTTTLKYKSDVQSESEAWSEPDRNVSRARIGLQDDQLKSTATPSTESTDDEKAMLRSSAKWTPPKKCHAINELNRQLSELERKLAEESERNEQLLGDLDATLARLAEAEGRKAEAEERATLLASEKDALLAEMLQKDKALQNRINSLEQERQEALEVAKEAEEVAESAKNELESMRNAVKGMDSNIRHEYEEELASKLAQIEGDMMQKITEIKDAAETEIAELQQNINDLHDDYTANYVKKCHVEEAAMKIKNLELFVEDLETRIVELTAAKEKLVEYEEKFNELRAELDNATLQYSEAVLEKTKIAGEKANMEHEYNQAILREVDLTKNVDSLHSEIVDLKQTHAKQMVSLQQHNSHLEMRTSELESANAELHNRLIKIQVGAFPANQSNFVDRIVSFRRQHSDNSGGYMSEDAAVHHNRVEQEERHESNSSPDLGIESDHGRFSSLENNLNAPLRPLLQTLELTESMNNLLDDENNEINPDDGVHCCQRTVLMATENSELKKKLLRTRRALEETVAQLTLANQRKKQVEKTICKQIHKTSQVLRKAKANLDSGSETDLFKK